MATIIPFSSAHYPVFTDLWNYAYPELTRTEIEMRLSDLPLNAQLKSHRWIAEQGGRVVGAGGYEYFNDELYHPRKFQIHVIVNREYQRRGIGRALYERVMLSLLPLNPLLVRAWARQDRVESIKFLAALGFVEEMSTCHSSLDVNSYDLSNLERYVRRLARYGYEIKNFREMGTDAEQNRRLHWLHCQLMLDIPSPEPPSLQSFVEYESKIRDSVELFDAHFVATHRGDYVGLCVLLKKRMNNRELYADTLGVRRDYRGRGVAQALSFSSIKHARDHGYDRISADNSIENRRIIALLESLGFANQSVWTLFSKTVSAEVDGAQTD